MTESKSSSESPVEVEAAPERIRVCIRQGKDDWIGIAYSSQQCDPDTIREYVRADLVRVSAEPEVEQRQKLGDEAKGTVAAEVVIDQDNSLDGLVNRVHYATIKSGYPTCMEQPPTVSTNADEVTCAGCLNVIRQRQNMDMGDWLK